MFIARLVAGKMEKTTGTTGTNSQEELDSTIPVSSDNDNSCPVSDSKTSAVPGMEIAGPLFDKEIHPDLLSSKPLTVTEDMVPDELSPTPSGDAGESVVPFPEGLDNEFVIDQRTNFEIQIPQRTLPILSETIAGKPLTLENELYDVGQSENMSIGTDSVSDKKFYQSRNLDSNSPSIHSATCRSNLEDELNCSVTENNKKHREEKSNTCSKMETSSDAMYNGSSGVGSVSISPPVYMYQQRSLDIEQSMQGQTVGVSMHLDSQESFNGTDKLEDTCDCSGDMHNPILREGHPDDINDNGFNSAENNTFPDFLFCLQCKNLMTKPRILSCLHTFCRACINLLECPQCGEPICNYDWNPENTKQLLGFRNVFIENKITLEENKKTDSALCYICIKLQTKVHMQGGEGRADVSRACFICVDCGDLLCSTCAERHNYSSFTLDHEIVSLAMLCSGEYDSQLRNLQKVNCTIHPQEAVEFYCADCHQTACRSCCQVEHRSHQILAQQVALETCRAEISGLVEELAVKLERIDTDKHDETMSELEMAESTEVDKLEAAVRSLISKIEKEKKTVLKKLKKTYKTNYRFYMKKKEETDNFIKTAKHSLQVVDELLRDGCSAEILSLSTLVEDQLKKLLNNDVEQISLKYEYLPQVVTDDICTNTQKIGLFSQAFQLQCNKEPCTPPKSDKPLSCFKSVNHSTDYVTGEEHQPVKHVSNQMAHSQTQPQQQTQRKIMSVPLFNEQGSGSVLPSTALTVPDWINFKDMSLTNQDNTPDFRAEQKGCLEDKKDADSATMTDTGVVIGNVEPNTEQTVTFIEKDLLLQIPNISIKFMGHFDIQFFLGDQCKKLPKLIAISASSNKIAAYDATNEYLLLLTKHGNSFGKLKAFEIYRFPNGTNVAVGSEFVACSSMDKMDIYTKKEGFSRKNQFNNSTCGHPIVISGDQLIVCNYKDNSVRFYDLKENTRRTKSFLLNVQIVDLAVMEHKHPEMKRFVFVSRDMLFSTDENGVIMAYYPEERHVDGWTPTSVSVDHQGNIFVVDAKVRKLLMFDQQCHLLGVCGLPEVPQPRAVACGNRGYIYITDENSQFIFAYTGIGV
ncbi:hypothetical protein ScPMuIL_006648 [Solemya velum]